MVTSVDLPIGVRTVPLEMHRDPRGVFTELFRQEWFDKPRPVQWNAVTSEANALRGVHVHLRHWDYLIVLRGRALFNLRDLRTSSPTFGRTAAIEMSGERLAALIIPPGVAHGFYFHEPSLHVYAVSEYWDLADELGCHFADPELGLSWPRSDPLISPRDAELPPLRSLMTQLAGRFD
jgi:dTDP-4-dehydrorhamnose 3,5-epimerase